MCNETRSGACGIPEDRGEVLDKIREPLLSWYEGVRRELPWRDNPTPYRVWISEIMLQQTRIEAVKSYYARFMKELPDIPSLAEVSEDKLLKLWEGLGYYSRAGNLKKAAVLLCRDYGGKMPASFEGIRALPGIGDYTAGAIASLAFGIPKPAVDGNVLRIYTRLFRDGSDIIKQPFRRECAALLEEHMDRENPGRYNEALMELGETVCLPGGKPDCEACPLSSCCAAYAAGEADRYPRKIPKKARKVVDRTIFLLERGGTAAVCKRNEKGLLASMFEFPGLDRHISPGELSGALGLPPEKILSAERLPDAVHIFSHVEWHMIGYRVRLAEDPPGFLMVQKEEILEKYPLPGAFRVYRECLLKKTDGEKT